MHLHYHDPTMRTSIHFPTRFVGLAIFALTGSVAPGLAQTEPPVAAAPTASSILQPALAQLQNSLEAVHLDKWKAPGPVREDASSNIGSIRRDLDGTLPTLLATADTAPGSVSRNFPVFRNVDALYDVLLRVTETAELAAPEAESAGLQAALSTLEDARRTLGDRIEQGAEAQEQQTAELGARLRSVATAPAQPATTHVHVVDDGQSPKPAAVTHHRKKSSHPEHPESTAPQ